jgi:hypothetical protein
MTRDASPPRGSQDMSEGKVEVALAQGLGVANFYAGGLISTAVRHTEGRL